MVHPPLSAPLSSGPAGAALTLLADDVAAERVAREAVGLAHARIIDADHRWPRPIGDAPGFIYLELSGPSAIAEAMLDAAAQTIRPLLVCFPETAIDLVAARLGTVPALFLCVPTMLDRVAALSMMSTTTMNGVGEIGVDADAARLKTIAEEVNRIGRILADLAGEEPERKGDGFADGMIGYRIAPAAPAAATVAPITSAEVRSLIRLRRLRERYFQADYFSDPIWDMLLDLTAARLERIPVAVSSLCIAAAVPPTTALRSIRQMTDAGLFIRVADPHDRRRVFIELSDATAEAMLTYLRAVFQTLGQRGG